MLSIAPLKYTIYIIYFSLGYSVEEAFVLLRAFLLAYEHLWTKYKRFDEKRLLSADADSHTPEI